MNEHPVEAHSDHLCVLAILTRRLAESREGDRAALAADAVDAMLRAGHFDRCCVPRYLALAPSSGASEVQIPIMTAGDIATRVIVWPVGSHDSTHPHTGAWTVLAPVRGRLEATVERDGDAAATRALDPRRPRILRGDDHVRHRMRNAGDGVGLSVHVFGSR